MNKIAAAYIRVSTDEQLEYSPDSQLRLIRDYATRNGFEIAEEHIFVDEGVSGRSAEKRPAFMRMISAAKSKPRPFDAILLWKFSRFARSRQDSIIYKSMLRRQLGIEVISVSENLGGDNISVLIEALIEAMDEYYSMNLGEEVRRGMTEKARRGEPLSIAPYGYRMVNGRLEEVPAEAAVIEAVFRRFASGDSPSAIARSLNSAGIRGPRGGKLQSRTVEYWLNNPVYNGKIRWTPDGKLGRDFSKPGVMVTEGGHRPIVPDSLWNAVREKLALSPAPKPRSHEPSHWLVGLIRCGICGGSTVNCGGYLYCAGKTKGLCCGIGRLTVNAVADALINILSSCPISAADICIERADAKAARPDALLDLARLRLRRSYEAYEAGIDTVEEYRANKTRIAAEIAALENEPASPPPSAFAKAAEIKGLLRDGEIPNSRKAAIIRSFLRSVAVSADEICFEFFI